MQFIVNKNNYQLSSQSHTLKIVLLHIIAISLQLVNSKKTYSKVYIEEETVLCSIEE